ncbi:hypothetical protein OAO65_02280 [Flavobacteriales bacterium]|nr:hypothetical protein [Flavobacteriales bacterium]
MVGKGGGSTWIYDSTDAATVVRAAGYITNGDALGMKVGDVVHQRDTAGATVAHDYVVNSVTAGGAVDLTDGTATPSLTDTD